MKLLFSLSLVLALAVSISAQPQKIDTLKIPVTDSAKVIVIAVPDTANLPATSTVQVVMLQDTKEDWQSILSALGPAFALLGVIVAVIIFIVKLWKQVRVQRAEYVYRLEDKYDNICRFRAEHPGITTTADRWESKPYPELSDHERLYYHYAEMVIGFMEIAIYMRYKDKSLSRDVFRRFITPMILFEVNYNRRLIPEFLNSAVMSPCSNHFVKQMLQLVAAVPAHQKQVPVTVLGEIKWKELDDQCKTEMAK